MSDTQRKLDEAIAARHALITVKKTASIGFGDRRIEYTAGRHPQGSGTLHRRAAARVERYAHPPQPHQLHGAGLMGVLRSALSRLASGAPVADAPTVQASSEVQGTRWRGASHSLRSLQNWVPAIGSGTSDLPSSEQRTLRARSRDAFRNHMVARDALTRCRTNIVGTGLMCRPSVDHVALVSSPDAAEVLNGQLRGSGERWAEDPAECDIEATNDIYGLKGLTLLSAMFSGDVFALTPHEHRAGCVSELKVQLVEADRISNPNDRTDTANCIDGVEIRGAMPIGYWVRSTHPGDQIGMQMPAWKFYEVFGKVTDRRRVLHVWDDKERPGQVRGAPYLAQIMEPLKQIERFGGAKLMAAVLSAMVTVFI